MKLYTFPRAPHCRKVDIFLLEKGRDIERVAVNLAEKANLQDDFLALNTRGVVPVLLLDDGQMMDESLAICRYLEALYPQPCLFGKEPEQIGLIASWERHMEFDGYQSAQEAFRNSHPALRDRAIPGFAQGFPAIPALAERARQRFEIFLTRLEQRLAASPCVGGDGFSIADITGILAIDTAKRVQMEIPAGHHHTRRWYETMYSRPSINSTFVEFK
ncbi:MAG: glutathione S-transferase family protein [Pseudomonadales bacterium]|nr:glutathione S-transferase family protein [Pseudomonadales bacterium]